MKKKAIYMILAFFIILPLFLFFIDGYTALFAVRNVSSYKNISIDINGKNYPFAGKKYNHFDHCFLFGKGNRLSVLDEEKNIIGNVCELDFKPFRSCAFEVVVNDKGAFCGKCFSF